MKSNWKIFWLILIIGGGLAFGYRSWIGSSVATEVEVKTIDDLVSHMLDIRAEQTLSVDSVDFGEETEINILLLGLDERKEETELEDAHCDAIHMFTLDVEQWTIHITSVPRGTGVYIP